MPEPKIIATEPLRTSPGRVATLGDRATRVAVANTGRLRAHPTLSTTTQ